MSNSNNTLANFNSTLYFRYSARHLTMWNALEDSYSSPKPQMRAIFENIWWRPSSTSILPKSIDVADCLCRLFSIASCKSWNTYDPGLVLHSTVHFSCAINSVPSTFKKGKVHEMQIPMEIYDLVGPQSEVLHLSLNPPNRLPSTSWISWTQKLVFAHAMMTTQNTNTM